MSTVFRDHESPEQGQLKPDVAANAVPIEDEVRRRYAAGAQQFEPGLCCPEAQYAPEFLDVLPEEILQKDYGCGDPSIHAREGDVVLDLGSGGGKVCYILSQKVGPSGRVIGADFNDVMLRLARKYQALITERIGYANVEFHKARIQDLALDLDRVGEWLAAHPIQTVEDVDRFRAYCDAQRSSAPLIPDDTVDLIVSNCVLNLVGEDEKSRVFDEMHRVLRPGGRAVISDIVSDEHATDAIRNDPELWSGCIAGAFREDVFLEMFANAGFGGIEIINRQAEPWQVIEGIEFRSLTVRAYKLDPGPCLERKQAVIFKGPWKSVVDDDGHRYDRGKRMAVCDKTFRMLTDSAGPYAAHMIGIEPAQSVPLESAEPFDCCRTAYRDPTETKDPAQLNVAPESTCCGPDGDCCDG